MVYNREMDDPKTLFQNAVDLARRKDLLGAERVLSQILAADSSEPNALRMLGSIKLANNEFELAADYLGRALKAAPDFATAQIELSQAHR